MYGHIILFEPSGTIEEPPRLFLVAHLALQVAPPGGVGFPVLPLILIPVPARVLIVPLWAWRGVSALLPHWALEGPIINPRRSYPNLPLGYQPYMAELCYPYIP